VLGVGSPRANRTSTKAEISPTIRLDGLVTF
jgi:hypothetical protein